MSAEAQLATPLATADWDGGTLPYRIGHKKLGMWLFIVSDALTFTALLMGYSYMRTSSDQWPTPFEFYPSIIFSSVMTLCLLSSSLTMVMAVQASAKGKKGAVRAATCIGTIRSDVFRINRTAYVPRLYRRHLPGCGCIQGQAHVP